MKKTVSFLLAILIVSLSLTVGFSDLPFKASATEIDYKCGDNATWYLDTKGVLTISGTGDMYDSVRPWKSYSSTIKSVVVEEGITGIGTYSLFDCTSAKKIYIASTVEYLDSFALPDNVTEIIVAENSVLSNVYLKTLTDTQWYKNQPADEPVYLGRCLLGMPEGSTVTSLEIKEGTYAINEYAFNKSTITDFTFPKSLTAIGRDAFTDSVWLESQPDGPVYAGNVFLTYKGYLPIEEVDYEIPEGIVGIAGMAFYDNTRLNTIKIPSSMEHIGEYAFLSAYNLYDIEFHENGKLRCLSDGVFQGCSKLKEIELPESLESIGEYCFVSAGLTRLHIPENVKVIHSYHFTRLACIEAYSVDEDNPFYCNDESGALYSKDMKILIVFPRESALTEYTVNQNCKIIRENAFSGSKLETINLNYGLEKIETNAFEFSKSNVYVSATVNTVNSYALMDFRGTVYCYENSAMHKAAVKMSKPFVLLDAAVDTSNISQLILSAESIERSLYTEESLAKLDEALNVVDLESTGLTQEQIVEWETAIEEAIENLDYLPADYSSVEDLKSRAEEIDRTLYTPESLAELDKALAAVDYDLTIDKQSQITEWVSAIETAIENLDYLPADYSAVEAQLNKVNVLDRRYYSEITLLALDNAVSAVEYGLDITQQIRVNGFAEAIAAALSKLDYAAIVLRHDKCGIVVSATTKEIKPDTVLTAQEVDPSNYEGTNFAVGGSIRSLHFYDINLVLKGEKVQPEGTVTVKIKLADGVNPTKCKVYHVTEDIVNPLVRFASTIDGNYIVFETTHFSEFAVIEVETVLDKIEITNLPDKTDYIAGESLNTKGLKVVARFSDGTSKEIGDYTVGMVNLNSAGTHKVTVYYTFGSITKTAEFNVDVTAKKITADITENGKSTEAVNKKLGLFSFYSKAAIQLDCTTENAEGCTLRWSSDNSKVMVDENGRVTCKGLFGAKKANIRVEVVDAGGNVVASDTVRVVFYKLSFQLSNAISQAIRILGKDY